MFRFPRRLALPALALALLSSSVRGQEPGLRLTASIVGQRYCQLSADADALQMHVRLRYTNTGNQKLILYRGVKFFYQILVSRNEDDAEDTRYETRTTHSRFFDQQVEKIDTPTPGSVFVTLSPGASYETEQTVVLPVARTERRVGNSIAAGSHVLQIVVSTWYESKKLADTLRARWQSRGLLWTNVLGSEVVNFNVAENRSVVVCQ